MSRIRRPPEDRRPILLDGFLVLRVAHIAGYASPFLPEIASLADRETSSKSMTRSTRSINLLGQDPAGYQGFPGSSQAPRSPYLTIACSTGSQQYSITAQPLSVDYRSS